MSVTTDTTLTEDHDGNIVIDADNVTLDCAGHTVMGTGTDGSAGTGVSIQGRTNVTVKNCHVTNFFQGFAVGGSTAIDLTENSANSNGEGFAVDGPSTDVTLEGNTANNNNSWGFIVASASGNTLIGNEASGNGANGFVLDTASDNELDSNEASGNGAHQFALGDSHQNHLLNNTSGGGAGDGFALMQSDGNTLEGNTATSSDETAGFTLGNSSDNVLMRNVAEGNAGNGFHVFFASSGNSFTANSSHANGFSGFHDDTVDLGTSGTANTYSDNVCIRNGAPDSDPPGLCNESGSFTDDDGNIFELDIEWMNREGITKGCNPPTNDQYCPDSSVTRGQMAAFLVRALGYSDDGGGNLFIDDDDSIFERDIDRLATAGVTKGCNPPVNDSFCPTSYVTRGQMAAFLHRALG
jgi:parallel beta-helix repeat protein